MTLEDTLSYIRSLKFKYLVRSFVSSCWNVDDREQVLQDVLQSVSIKVYLKYDTLENFEESTVKAWVYIIAKNTYGDIIRQKVLEMRRRVRSDVSEVDRTHPESCSSEISDTILDVLLVDQLFEEFLKYTLRPLKDVDAWYAKYVKGLSFAEIALIQNRSILAVKSGVYRTRQSLKKFLVKKGYDRRN